MSTPRLETRWLGRVDYAAGLEIQASLATGVREGRVPGTLLLLEHDSVYTIGRTPDKSSLATAGALPHPVVEISRGGQATYHGPGQLVGYFVIALDRYGKDLHRYLRTIEDGLITACAAAGVTAQRREGLTGVWVAERKLASIGVGVRQWITQHGFALNVTPESLAGFQAIIPCGIQGVQMTCLQNESGRTWSVQDFAASAAPHLVAALLRDAE